MSGATVPIAMPHMGVSVTEGTVLEWLKAEGDEVRAEEVVCLVSTDKVDVDVPAPADGVLARIVAAPGETVEVGEPLAELAVERGAGVEPAAPEGAAPAAAQPAPAAPDAAPAAGPAAPAEAAAPAGEGAAPAAPRPPAVAAPRRFDSVAAAEAAVPAAGRNGGPVCSPVARRLAERHGLDLRSIRGSGLRGRIRKADVLAAIEHGERSPAAAELLRGYDDVPREVVALSRVRSVMAEHMIRSRRTAAHMTTEVEVDMSAADRARAELNASRERRLTPLALIARAACAALRDYPDLNASFDGERLIRWREVNLGIAVDTEQGLMVPVIRRADRLTAAGLGDAIADVAARARERRLVPDDVRAGTFTISNPGSVGATSAMAIINQPQVAILGTPAIVRRPVVVIDEHGAEAIAIRPVMTLALTFDHRVIDGAYATRAAVRVKEHLETWTATAYA